MMLKNISQVKFSEKILNFFELLCFEKRSELAEKTILGVYLLKEDKDEKIAFIKQEINSTIHIVKELPDRALLNELMLILGDNVSIVESFAELFKKVLRKGINLVTVDEMVYQDSVLKVESLLNSSEKNKLSGLLYGDLLKRKNEVFELPKIKLLIDILVYLHHIDILYRNLDAVKNSRPLITKIPEDDKTVEIIRSYFNELTEMKNFEESPFLNKNNYNQYVDLLTMYFEGYQYELPPKGKIDLKPSIKTVFATTLGQIHRRFKQTYVADQAFFDIVRVLKPYEMQGNISLQKAIRKGY